MVAKAFIRCSLFVALYSKRLAIDKLLFALFGFQFTVSEVFVIWQNTKNLISSIFARANDISVLLFLLLVSYCVP